ncbi:peptidase M23 [Gordoniibacillus kamchatkensis]|uniref:Peptidase M23 n=1 Tax=Gordoniibacillus kamchatkensis TaxID=1590651 RepID=A0ABR5AKZ7_9BACL|nr:peptidoglycan DD-metalloendopeptidase family protein [Paenibacillus sp. VKM B-2647]KIL41587.1 peptidase M23 [Paenibacillus sp. VKM B-2647]
MKKIAVPLAVSAVLASALAFPAAGLAGQTADSINQQLNDLKKAKSAAQKKATDTQNQLAQVQKDKAQSSKDLNSIYSQIDEIGKKLTDLNNQIDKTTGDLETNAKQLDDAQNRVAARDQMLKSRLRLMYMNGFVSYAEVLMSATNFGDFLDRFDALKSILNQDKEILESNKRDRDVIADKKTKVEQQLAQVKQLYDQTNDVKESLQAKEREKEVVVASLSKKEKELEDISQDQQDELVKFAAQESALLKQKAAAEAAAAAAAKKKGQSGGKSTIADAFTYSGGKFGYPLAKQAPMTSDFGVRVDPINGKEGAFHTGIDLGAPQGTDILAAENGVVIVASWWSGYGNCVIIDHGGGVWTLYGHIRDGGIVVEKGDKVKRGQKIAEVGHTGRATGNHLHFEVRINEKPVDPKPYLR